MDTDNLTHLFDDLKGTFDIEEPRAGHDQRFLEKLQAQAIKKDSMSTIRSLWKPFLGIAASIALVMTLMVGLQSGNDSKDLASVSPEMAETQSFFTTTIASELEKLKKEDSPEFKQLVDDAILQITILEEDYTKLKNDLTVSGEDKRVIVAMITNFQNRISLLENVLEQIDEIKKQKNTPNENSSTL